MDENQDEINRIAGENPDEGIPNLQRNGRDLDWTTQVRGTASTDPFNPDDSIDHGEAMDSLWVELEDRINHSTYNGKTFFDYYRKYRRTHVESSRDTQQKRGGLFNQELFNEHDVVSFARRLITEIDVNNRSFQNLAEELQIPESILKSMHREFIRILRGRVDNGRNQPPRMVQDTRRDINTRLEQAVDRYPAPRTGISRYIEKYPDNELAEVGFTRLSNLLQPLADGSFDWEHNFNKVFDQACELIEMMIYRLGVTDQDDVYFRKFESDICLCGHYATQALDLVLFRLAQRGSPKNISKSSPITRTGYKKGIARYITSYHDNGLATNKFVTLTNLLQPLYGPNSFSKKRYKKIFNHAIQSIENMIKELNILDDEALFQKFKSDILSCGYYATRALTLVLFRLAKKGNPNQG